MSILGKVTDPLTSAFNLGIGSGGKGFGGFLNNISGATGASNLQQKYNLINGAVNQAYALQSARMNHAYQKEFAQNAHQWEIEDLKKAGLNPVLSAGGSGASASGGGVSSGATSGAGLSTSGINPLDVILNGVSTMTTAKRTNQEAKNLQAQEKQTAMQTLAIAEQTATSPVQRKEIQKKINLLSEQTTAQEIENEKNQLEVDWIKEHPTAYSMGKYLDIFGDTAGKVLDIGSKLYMGGKAKGIVAKMATAMAKGKGTKRSKK